MEISGAGKSPNTSLSFRYNANNEELEELLDCEDDPPTPVDASPSMQSENASPKKGDKTSSILDKYFKSIRNAEKIIVEKDKEEKPDKTEVKCDEGKPIPKEVTSSPVKDYLKNLGKRSVSESADVKDVGGNETWKIFHDFKYKITQAVEDMKTRSLEETKEKDKSIPRDSSISDSEENSVIKDSDQSIGDTDNQVSSLNSSIQNLSEITQPLTAKPTDIDLSLPMDKNGSEASDDTEKNLVQSEMAHLKKDKLDETNAIEVESGIEALEDNIDGFNVATNPSQNTPVDKNGEPSTKAQPMLINFSHTPSQINYVSKNSEERLIPFFTFTFYTLSCIVILGILVFPESSMLIGFLLGIWVFYFFIHLKNWVLENYFGDPWESRSHIELPRSSDTPFTYTIPSVKEYRPIKKYEGWINHFRFPDYDPLLYSINKTTTCFIKLEGCNLRLSYTTTKIPKRALWNEKLEKVEFYQHRLYNLTGAKVVLLPKGLVRRRQWSKKYPICIMLNENEKIQVLEKESVPHDKKSADLPDKKKEQAATHEVESTETNTSPEKKKKFVWRRKDKSNLPTIPPAPHTENEIGKEGLRHRLVRKKHKEKKTDTIPSSTIPPDQVTAESLTQSEKPPEEQVFHDARADMTDSNTSTRADADTDLDLDDAELANIKEVLEQTELDTPTAPGTSEGEWTVNVKRCAQNYACLYLFARTGRAKFDWFRRLSMAVEDVSPSKSAEASVADDASEAPPQDKEQRDGIEMAVYKTDKIDNVTFARRESLRKKSHSQSSDGVTVPANTSAPEHIFSTNEETFWPFLHRIIQNHEQINICKLEVGVMCQLEPSPRKNSKYKKVHKKSKDQNQPQNQTCECRVLPSEVTWVNTVLARVIYDLVHNESIQHRLEARIQRKLHTLKLPAFMSPLVVTDLSLAGACPLIERVSPPTWDERGVWLDADLRYDGGGTITILTQINLMKLKEKNLPLEESISIATDTMLESAINLTNRIVQKKDSFITRPKLAVFDSDMEDSAESSDDDVSPPLQHVDSVDLNTADNSVPPSEAVTPSGSSKKKFLRMVDKIATNKYFQTVTDYKYVKRAMEGLSNTDIKLQVEVQSLEGRLAINLPQPPHDRIWFGFRTNPQLVLKARPAVGARTLRFAHVTNWIEEKLAKEFEKILVMPNMEDIQTDILTPTPVNGPE